MNFKKTTIEARTEKRFYVLGKGHRNKKQACKALATHLIMHKFFEYDVDNKRFERDKNGDLIPCWKFMSLPRYDFRRFNPFKSEQDYEANRDKAKFNRYRWERMHSRITNKLLAQYKDL